jgi:hypothetical protein
VHPAGASPCRRTPRSAGSEKGVTLARRMQVGPCSPVRLQLPTAEVGPTSRPARLRSHLLRERASDRHAAARPASRSSRRLFPAPDLPRMPSTPPGLAVPCTLRSRIGVTSTPESAKTLRMRADGSTAKSTLENSSTSFPPAAPTAASARSRPRAYLPSSSSLFDGLLQTGEAPGVLSPRPKSKPSFTCRQQDLMMGHNGP